MSVILETSKGDIVVDLFVEECPKTCQNFLKLCKIKYYNNCIFHYVQRNFLVQTGDPTSTGKGGDSIHGLLYGAQARFFADEIKPFLKHKEKGLLGMASAGQDLNAAQFYITTGDNLYNLDEKHTIFGQVAEGWEVLEAINDAPCDDDGRPLQNIRIRHTIILDDPTPDPDRLDELIPENSPEPEFAHDDRLEDDWEPDKGVSDPGRIDELHQEREAKNRAVVLEMIGDLPEADAEPPSTMLFICKLNPVTTEEDLEIIFSRFGKVTSCDIIRDWKTGDSLCYGFIGFENESACEEAYFKMNNVLIDDRRIKVDFSQSVYHLWKQFRRFGTKGKQDWKEDADAHQRKRPQLELKDKYKAHAHMGDYLLDSDSHIKEKSSNHSRDDRRDLGSSHGREKARHRRDSPHRKKYTDNSSSSRHRSPRRHRYDASHSRRDRDRSFDRRDSRRHDRY